MRTIIMRELLDNYKTRRWIILLVLCIVLFSLNGFIFSRKYEHQNKEYITRITEPPVTPRSIREKPDSRYSSQERFETNGGPNYPRPSTVATEVYVPPSPMLFVASGGDRYRPYGYDVRPGFILRLPEKPSNYKLPEYNEIDWSFIIQVIIVLYVLIFGYNTISEEKEQGTLALVLSNALSRSKVILAKYVVLMATTGVPVVVGALVSLIIIQLHIPAFLSMDNILKLLCVGLATGILLSLFSFLSLLVSSIFHDSSRGILILLIIWIIFLTFPLLANTIVDRGARVFSDKVYSQQLHSYATEVNNLLENQYEHPDLPTFRGGFNSELEAQEILYPIYLAAHNEIIKMENAHFEYTQNVLHTSHAISRVSPLSLFQYSLENICGTGFHSEEQFYDHVRSFSMIYDNYVREKLGELRVYSGTRISTMVLLHDERGPYLGGIDAMTPKEYEGDKSDFPRFVAPEPSIISILNDSMKDIVGLLIWNLVLAMAAFLTFQRADIR